VLDNLTGLYNTRYLYQALEGLVAASAPDGSPFSVLFIDLDHFKRVVDRRGHLNGSRAIQEVAATIRSCLAPPAWAVAYAGDEFVVVLPGFSRVAALEKAVEIRTTIRQTAYLATTEQPIRLAASFGVATYPTTRANLSPPRTRGSGPVRRQAKRSRRHRGGRGAQAVEQRALTPGAVLEALLRGTTDPELLAELSCGKIRKKIPELRRALSGATTVFWLDASWLTWTTSTRRSRNAATRSRSCCTLSRKSLSG
jgi:diguanylate cyclase (GGDEF)-like protein